MKRSLDIAAIVLTSLLLLGFAVLSVRGFIDPQPASARFGMPGNFVIGRISPDDSRVPEQYRCIRRPSTEVSYCGFCGIIDGL